MKKINKQEKELSLPRVIEVYHHKENEWFRRVVFMFKNNKALCWTYAQTLEEAEKTYDVTIWEHWREIGEKTELIYRPFTWEERDLIRNKWVRYKNTNLESQVIDLELFKGELLITLGKGATIKSKDLFNYYEFLDGKICGIKVE